MGGGGAGSGGAGSSSSSGDVAAAGRRPALAPLLTFEQLLFCCFLLCWQSTVSMLFTRELPVPPGGREAAYRSNLQAGRRMAELLPGSPMGWFVASSAAFVLEERAESWRCIQRGKQVAEESNDSLMAGIAWVKSWQSIEHGGAGNRSYTLQQLADVYQQAKIHERRFKDWCPKGISLIYYATANGLKAALDKAAAQGVPMTAAFEVSLRGLLQQSEGQLADKYRQLTADVKCDKFASASWRTGVRTSPRAGPTRQRRSSAAAAER